MIVEEQGMGFRTGVRLPSGPKEKGSEEALAYSLPFSYGPEGSHING